MSELRSCFNCKYVKVWHYSATWNEPSDDGYECGHPNYNDLPYKEIEPDPECQDCYGTGHVYCGGESSHECRCWDESNDEVKAAWDAKECPGYEYFDWKDYEQQQAIAEADLEVQMAKHEVTLEMYHTTYHELGVEVNY